MRSTQWFWTKVIHMSKMTMKIISKSPVQMCFGDVEGGWYYISYEQDTPEHTRSRPIPSLGLRRFGPIDHAV